MLPLSEVQVNVKFSLFLRLRLLVAVIITVSQNVLTYFFCSFTEILQVFKKICLTQNSKHFEFNTHLEYVSRSFCSAAAHHHFPHKDLILFNITCA